MVRPSPKTWKYHYQILMLIKVRSNLGRWIPTLKTIQEQFANIFLNHWIMCYGILSVILTDNRHIGNPVLHNNLLSTKTKSNNEFSLSITNKWKTWALWRNPLIEMRDYAKEIQPSWYLNYSTLLTLTEGSPNWSTETSLSNAILPFIHAQVE